MCKALDIKQLLYMQINGAILLLSTLLILERLVIRQEVEYTQSATRNKENKKKKKRKPRNDWPIIKSPLDSKLIHNKHWKYLPKVYQKSFS